jgi:hypothetical protein|tara:strand:- start:3816 stop:4052 length:237 start_codon:yes stop_codon:yes gene_type:complete
MSEEQKQIITINDQEYSLEDLAVESQLNVRRISALRQELGSLEMQAQEKKVLIQAYSDAVIRSVSVVEEDQAQEESAH